MPSAIWVIDTSSLVVVTENLISPSRRPHVLRSMSDLVAAGHLKFPKAVLKELQRGHNARKGNDPPYDWAKRNKETAAENASDALLRRVLSRVPTIIDPHKTGEDEADPYVLGLALYYFERGITTTVVTDDRRDKHPRVSCATGAGILGIPTVPLTAFLTIHAVEYSD